MGVRRWIKIRQIIFLNEKAEPRFLLLILVQIERDKMYYLSYLSNSG
jgi:hypothetical protein